MMGVSDRDREGISGIGTGDCRAREQALNHGMDLNLLGRTDSDHGLLDQGGRIFAYVDPCARRYHQGNAAGLAELECRLRVLVDEHFLDRRRVRRMIGKDCLKLRGEVGEPLWQGLGGVGLQLPVGDMGQAVALGANESPAGRAQPGVEAEDQAQPSFSNSSSLIS